MTVLGIETSCDETAVAIYDEEKGLLSNVISSQIEIHKEWGGVFPELAAREHTKNILPVLDKALKDADVNLNDLDAVAFTAAPGLIVSLVIGVSAAKSLAFAIDKPLVPVHHIEAHIFATFLEKAVEYPFLALVVSGGHTELYIIKDFEDYKYLGGTIDDAVGEAYDKVARMLGLGYPGGPIIDKLSEKGVCSLELPRPLLKGKSEHKYNFSFSGLKTAVLRETEKQMHKPEDIAKSFQEAVVEVLVKKTTDAAIEHNVKSIVVAGGVSANKRLREKLKQEAEKRKINVVFPPLYLCTDNAAMVAYTGYLRYKKGKTVGYEFQPHARIRMDKFVKLLLSSD